MNESHDPLKSLFEEAAAAGRARASYAPATEITARGRRAHRRRLAVLAASACLVVGGAGAGLAALVNGPSQPVLPATTPSVGGPTPARTSTTTEAPYPRRTTAPPLSTSTSAPPLGTTTTSPPGGAG
ncbi:hypothetical protein ACFCWY_26390 [Streptomyces sp. NPDC056362]|uniref:hypothetical protein n=1 Tax=unclassified Streptomyces TaxID=2593676 RepID=UPI0035D5CD9D